MTMDKSIEKLLTSGYRLDVYALRADVDADQAAAQLADEFVNRLAGCEDEGFISMVKAENGYFYEAVLVYKHGGGSSGGGNGSSDPEVKPEPDPEPEPVEYAVIWDNSTKTLTCRATKTTQAWMEMESTTLSENAVKTALSKQGEEALEGFSLRNVEKLVIENQSGLMSIGKNAFGSFVAGGSQVENTTLREVDLSSIMTIGNDTFANCVNLEKVYAPQVISVGLRAFYNCETLKSVDMPYLNNIGNTEAFAECSSLTTVNMPVLTEIPNDTFRDCTSLTTVNLPRAEIIGSGAFMSCGLSEITLPAATDIGINAFWLCKSLQSIDLPKAHTFGAQAFNSCSALNTVKLGTKLQSVGKELFKDTPNSFTICYGGDNFENDINDAKLTNGLGASVGDTSDRMKFIGLSGKTITYQKY